LLKRQGDMTREIATAVTHRNQAEKRAEHLADQSSREIDELELQIKSLRDQDQRSRIVEVPKMDASVLTERRHVVVVGVQTGLSFQYGFDLDSGQQVRPDIFLKQLNSKQLQTEWPSQPQHVGLQVSPSTQSVAIQVSSAQ